ncbi:MAG: hypothetical protein PHH59_03785 [Methylovulum sp.]|uniref:hypothetical protein n=1 Tax=Methylovulum sp. TaxID=1916980 RepID=UPI0026117D39|nr:hypothetical protein [Methylovulum sp.]MDD2723128.1 hypothetical protein [Methylovulum sp.]MDD5124819.1 hypothetical protein [Methylovulum sp.]
MKIYRFIRVALPVLIVLGFLFWLWWHDVVSDKTYKLEALALITLLKDPPQNYPEINVAMGQILPGETVKVLRMGYGKDFRAWLVMGSNKQEGWFIEDGKNVRVSKK